MNTPVPPAPPAPPEQDRYGAAKFGAFIAAVGIVAFVVFLATSGGSDDPEPTASTDVVVEDTGSCISLASLDRSISLMTEFEGYMTSAANAVNVGLLDEATLDITLAIGAMDDVANLWASMDSEVSAHAKAAASYLQSSLDALQVGDYAGAGDYADAGSSEVEAMTARVDELNAMAIEGTLQEC